MGAALVIRHVAFEDLGTFEEGLKAADFTIRYVEAGVDDVASLDAVEPDLLIVLGGPISANDEAAYPFLNDELRLLERRLERNSPIMGICLGAQLLTRAAGGKVYPAGENEIGFLPISLTEAGRASCLAPFEADSIVLHWHGDQCELPEHAIRLASTEVCANQAFSIGRNAIGLQFHPEISARGFERWLIGHTLELSLEGRDVAGLRAEAQLHDGALRTKGGAFLTAWLAQLER